MAEVKNWVVQESGTVGTGNIVLGAAVEGFASFASAFAGPAEVWYSLEDNGNREAGIANFDGNNTLARTTVMATFLNGVYNDTTPQAISLSGEATISCTYNKVAFDRGFRQTEISDTPPTDPQPDDIWWDSTTGRQFIWYNDGTSAQWVQTSQWNSGVAGATVPDGLYVLTTLYDLEIGDINNLVTVSQEVVGAINEVKGLADAAQAAAAASIQPDGSIEMDGGYTPATPQAVATKQYVDDTAAPVSGVSIERIVYGRSASFAVQEPAPANTNVPFQIEFGAGFATPEITVAANGDITFHQTTQYQLEFVLHAGRMGGGGGDARFLMWSEINGAVPAGGTSVMHSFTDNDAVISTNIFDIFDATAGDVLRIWAMRDGGGGSNNSGGLYPLTPNNPAAPDVASANIVASKPVATVIP